MDELPLTLGQIEQIIQRIRATGVPYLLVGGEAVVSSGVFSQTQDLDVMVAVRNFAEMIRKLKADPLFGTPDRVGWVAKYELRFGPRPTDYSEFDLLNGKKYCGDRTPDEFFDYLMESWVVPSAFGPSAQIPAVWYTRLMVKDAGAKYVRKVVRDIRAGASIDLFDEVREIARYCGTEAQIAPRIEQVHEVLAEVT